MSDLMNLAQDALGIEPRPKPTAREVSPMESLANALVGSVYNPANPSGLHRAINAMRGVENPPQMRLDAAMPQGPGKLFHGSPKKGLTQLTESAPKQFDNATSQFGVFFTPNKADAARYAGKAGHIYETVVDLKKPYEMKWGDFGYFQNINKSKAGASIPPEQWPARQLELQREAAQLRQELQAKGHDGIIVRNSKGEIVELASFNPVNLAP